MRADVHLEGGERGVALGAVLARERPLDLVVGVQLLVPGGQHRLGRRRRLPRAERAGRVRPGGPLHRSLRAQERAAHLAAAPAAGHPQQGKRLSRKYGLKKNCGDLTLLLNI